MADLIDEVFWLLDAATKKVVAVTALRNRDRPVAGKHRERPFLV